MSVEEMNAGVELGKREESDAGRSASLAGQSLDGASAGILAVKAGIASLFEQYRAHMEGVADAAAHMIGAQRHGEAARDTFARATGDSGRNDVLMADAAHVPQTAEVIAGQLTADQTEFADPGFGALIEVLGNVAARAAGRAEQAESVVRLSNATIADADEFIATT